MRALLWPLRMLRILWSRMLYALGWRHVERYVEPPARPADVRVLRSALGLSQRAFGRACNPKAPTDSKTVSDWEHGRKPVWLGSLPGMEMKGA